MPMIRSVGHPCTTLTPKCWAIFIANSLPLYPRDAWFARVPERLPPMLVIHGDCDGKTPYDAAVRHIAVLRKAGPVQLYTAEGGGHFVLWSDTGCARAAVTKFVLGDEVRSKCVSIRTAH